MIRFEQVGVRYPGRSAAVLSGVDLHVPEGELAWSSAAPGRASRRCCAPSTAWCRTSPAGCSPAG